MALRTYRPIKNIVIYARYSSNSQTEQSIEGQLNVCYEYARRNEYIIIGEYIDRATTGTNDHRPEFQKMIEDADNGQFDAVLVYQLDRFSRNRYDSALYKKKLADNGIRVISANEPIGEDASSILVEGLLESVAEYYSFELSQKIKRGMKINAQKGLCNGSNPGLGYKVNDDKTFSIDEVGAGIVKEIYTRFVSGERRSDIVADLKNRGIKTSIGNDFTYNSLTRILTNRRYIGFYIYKGEETPNVMPRILDDDLFYNVQRILEERRNNAPKYKKEHYLLSAKMICGYCNDKLVGISGTSKTGKQHFYYTCQGVRKKMCSKKSVRKDWIEQIVLSICSSLVMDSGNVEFISTAIEKHLEENKESITIRALKEELSKVNKARNNLLKAIEQGKAIEVMSERLAEREREKEEIEKKLAMEVNKSINVSANQIAAFLRFSRDFISDNCATALVGIFLNAVIMFDDYVIVAINTTGKASPVDRTTIELLVNEMKSMQGLSVEEDSFTGNLADNSISHGLIFAVKIQLIKYSTCREDAELST